MELLAAATLLLVLVCGGALEDPTPKPHPRPFASLPRITVADLDREPYVLARSLLLVLRRKTTAKTARVRWIGVRVGSTHWRALWLGQV